MYSLHLPRLSTATLLASAIALSACGGGGGGGSSSGGGSSDQTISGIVADPAIANASVWLVDASNNALSTIFRSGSDGSYSFNLGNSIDLSNSRVIANGGRDSETGHSFSGISLTAPYAGDGNTTYVTPLSTLAVSYQQQGNSLANFAALLGLDEAAVLGAPSASAAAQRANLLTTEMMAALLGSENLITTLLDALVASDGDFSDATDTLANDNSLPDSVREKLAGLTDRIAELNALNDTLNDADAVVNALNRINIHTAVSDYLAEALDFTASSDTEENNVGTLADALWQSLGQNGLPVDSAAIQNIVRYVVVNQQLDASRLADGNFSLGNIDPDGLIAELAESVVLNTRLALASGEELGDDNDARINYFFQSDASPYFRAAQLFDGILDDLVVDPAYVNIVKGLANAGLTEQASLLVESSIFQSREQAEAQQEIGRALLIQGQEDAALAMWEKALNNYNHYLSSTEDETGVANLDSNAASFYRTLSDDLREAGYTELAESVLQPVYDFIDAQAGVYSTAYARLAIAISRNADAAVTLAEESGLTGSNYSDAVNAAEFAYTVVSNLGKQSSSTRCYGVRTSMLSSVAGYFQRLGMDERAIQVLDDYEALFTGDAESCNADYAAGLADNYADIYGSLGLGERYKNFLATTVRAQPDGISDEADALAEFAVYEALELALAGDVEAAITKVEDSQEGDVKDTIEKLTYIGTGRNDGGRHYLSRLLDDEGATDAALEVADAAFAMSLTETFAEQESLLSNYIGQGCRKVATLYQWLGRSDLATSRMDECAAKVESRMSEWASAEQAEAWGYLAESYQFIGAYQASLSYVVEWSNAVSSISDPLERAEDKSEMGVFAANAGDFELALSSLNNAMDELANAASPSSDQDLIEDVLDAYMYRAEDYIEVTTSMLSQITRDGNTGQAGYAVQAWDDLKRALIGDDGESGALPVLDALNDSEDREEYMEKLLGFLAQARAFDESEILARKATVNTSRNTRLAAIAEAMSNYDDFPGTTVANFDFDHDGLPDFFNPGSSEEERNALPITLDDDIDGDSIPDSSDSTPYYAENL